jgi:phosphoglycerate dehydrogenase-like enzyme
MSTRSVSPQAQDLTGRTVYLSRDHMLADVIDSLQERLVARGAEVIRGPESRPGEKVLLPRERWAECLGRAEIAMFSSRSVCTKEMIEAAPRLLGLVNPTIGLETVDTDAASKLGIIVGHGATPENFNSIGESTVMLMLMLLYKPETTREVARGNIKRPRTRAEDAWAQMLMRKTVGLVGFGRIGRSTAKRLQGWDVRILATDPFIDPKSVPPYVELVDLDTVLTQSDVVSCHIAITPRSRHLMNAAAFAKMKPSAYFINTARGDAVDEPALIAALQAKRIAGAGIDTTAIEPPALDNPLQSMPNVFLTPHLIGHTKEVYASFLPAAEENFSRILKGELPLHCKNPEIAEAWRARYRRLRA